METVKIRRELDVIIKIPEYFITAEHKFQDLDDNISYPKSLLIRVVQKVSQDEECNAAVIEIHGADQYK